jgi:hypothetical protein
MIIIRPDGPARKESLVLTGKPWGGLRRRAVTVVTAFAALMVVAAPAHASYAVTGAAWGTACGTRTYYSSFSGSATPDGQIKVDFTNFVVGGKATLPCGYVSQICVTFRVTAHTDSTSHPFATTAPFGTMTQNFQNKNAPIVSGSEAFVVASSCGATNAQSVSVNLNAGDASPFIYTGRYKLHDYKIESRARILYAGTYYTSPWATYDWPA